MRIWCLPWSGGGSGFPHLATAGLTVPGMGSNHCAGLVGTSLERLPDIAEIETNSVEGAFRGQAADRGLSVAFQGVPPE